MPMERLRYVVKRHWLAPQLSRKVSNNAISVFAFSVLINMDCSVKLASGGSSPQTQSFDDPKPTLLGIPQELRNKIVSAKWFDFSRLQRIPY